MKKLLIFLLIFISLQSCIVINTTKNNSERDTKSLKRRGIVFLTTRKHKGNIFKYYSQKIHYNNIKRKIGRQKNVNKNK